MEAFPLRDQSPVQAGEKADVIHMNPRPKDGDFFNAELLQTVGAPEWVRQTAFQTDKDGPERIRRTGFVEVDDHRHFVRMSGPEPSYVARGVVKTRVLFPGWTEAIDAGSHRHLHDAVARAHPDEKTISIATDGLSVNGEPLPYRQAINRSFKGMAEARCKIIGRLAGNEPVTLAGTSMGSVLAIMTAHRNLELPPEARIDIRKLCLLNPGVIASQVPDHEIFRKSPDSTIGRTSIFLEFLGHMAVDIGREATRHPVDAAKSSLGVLAIIGAVLKEPDKGTAVAGNLLQLMEGTPWQTIKEVVQHYDTYVLTGEKDTLREDKQWQMLAQLYPGKVRLSLVKRRGHAMSVAAEKTARAMAA